MIEYYVVGTYEDGSECDETLDDLDAATTRAGYLIENFHCSVMVVDSNGNEYKVF